MRNRRWAPRGRALIFLFSLAFGTLSAEAKEEIPYKVYLLLGFHTSFYHSWRGDTPDEAGFGTDIRVVREILKMLNEANAQGLDARGYWDFDNYWTFEQIIPEYAPDIIVGIRGRVEAGQDEILPGPYNNGANHAATEDEFRAALAWALENPFGSGAKQLFGRVTPIYRSQECMFTTGQNRIFLAEGIQGHILYYSSIPFNSISAFIPALPPEQRYNPLWFRSRPEDEPLVLFPAVSPGDVVNYISMERWLLDLRKLQTSGRVKSDLMLHINFDADAETWLPVNLPKGLRWLPNTGGLVEYIHAVNKYDWAEFTTPGAYLRDHPPQAEVLVRQDLADGAFDGNYSWAEKYASLNNWTMLEQSRLHSYRATALAKRVPPALAREIEQKLWVGTDSSFFQRLIGLSTTHFGMSTPIINEERQAKAELILGRARSLALAAEQAAAAAVRRATTIPKSAALYEIEVYNYARGKNASAKPARSVVRLPVVLPAGIAGVKVKTGKGESVPASLLNTRRWANGMRSGEIWFLAELGPEERRIYQIESAEEIPSARRVEALKNEWLELQLDQEAGISSFRFQGQEVGGRDFLKPFISYRSREKPESYYAAKWEAADLGGEEQWDGVQRARLSAEIPLPTPHGIYISRGQYTFTLFEGWPYLLAEVEMHYAYTPPEDVIHTVQQKLRRLLDLRWMEVAPFQLNPAITAPAENPLRVWKHNYLGITSSYELNYGRINPGNRNLDSFNHQVTAGWVAMSNGRQGLLVAENAETLASLAFCPMRLREVKGIQYLSLNPFGSYFGRQLDYTHLGGNGVGTGMALLASGSLKPNAPSYNGEKLKFFLLIAPYVGDAPPVELQDQAEAFFYPFGVVYLHTPAGIEAALPEEMRELLADEEKAERRQSHAPLPAPTAFLANPSDQAVDLVWDEPRDERVTGYEVRWKEKGGAEWRSTTIGPGHRHHLGELNNARTYLFQVRALAEGNSSEWTPAAECTPGPVKTVSMLSAAAGAPVGLIFKTVYYLLVGAVTTP